MARTKFDEKRNKEARAAKFAGGSPTKAAAEPEAPAKKPRKRRKDRKRWVRQVKRYQTGLPAGKFVPLRPLRDAAREALEAARPGAGFRFTKGAIKVLHETVVDEIGSLMADANAIVVNRGGETLRKGDMKLAQAIINKAARRFSAAAAV